MNHSWYALQTTFLHKAGGPVCSASYCYDYNSHPSWRLVRSDVLSWDQTCVLSLPITWRRRWWSTPWSSWQMMPSWRCSWYIGRQGCNGQAGGRGQQGPYEIQQGMQSPTPGTDFWDHICNIVSGFRAPSRWEINNLAQVQQRAIRMVEGWSPESILEKR